MIEISETCTTLRQHYIIKGINDNGYKSIFGVQVMKYDNNSILFANNSNVTIIINGKSESDNELKLFQPISLNNVHCFIIPFSNFTKNGTSIYFKSITYNNAPNYQLTNHKQIYDQYL